MALHGSFKQEEYLVAAIGGAGLTAAMVGAAMWVMNVEPDTAEIAVYAGLVVIAGAVALWLVLLKPWLEFDDLKTPFYTGHHHDHHDDHHEVDHVEGVATVSSAQMSLDEAPIADVVHEPPVAQAAPLPSSTKADDSVAVESLAQMPSVETVAAEVVPPLPVTTTAPEPSSTTADELTIIEGIGEKIAEALNKAGISTFAHVAAKPPAELEEAVKAQNVDLVGDAKTWPRQAKLAAAGDANGLEDLKRRIKEGKVFDDLTIIEGIGPKIQQLLRDHGIILFADLAETDVEHLRQIIRSAKLPSSPDTWPQQAGYLVKGDLSGFEHYKTQLKGGREVSSD